MMHYSIVTTYEMWPFLPTQSLAKICILTGMYLQLLFGSIAEVISALMHRFDGLPIHKLVHYQSYNQGVLQNLVAAVDMRSGQLRTLVS
jgi:hypothetical protein